MQQYRPLHPGAFIKRVYLEPNALGPSVVASRLQVSISTFNRLINEKTGISPTMALKLSKVLGRSPESWLSMQHNFDLWKIKSEIDLSRYKPLEF